MTGLKGLKEPLCCVLQELQSKKEFPADVEGSRRLIDEHTQLKKKVRELLSGQSDVLLS